MENARRKRESMEFVLAITKTVKTTNIPVSNQIILIYTGIKLKFCRDFFKFTEKTTVDSCFQKWENNKKLWWGIITAKNRSFDHPLFNYQSNRNAKSFRQVG